MSEQSISKHVDQPSAASDAAEALSSNLWHTGASSVNTLTRGCGDASTATGTAKATVSEDCINFAANGAGSSGHASDNGTHRATGHANAQADFADFQGLPGRPNFGNGDAYGHGESGATIIKGDTYWSIAHQLEGPESTDQQVLNRMKTIQKFNHDKPLRVGEDVILAKY